MRIFTPGQRDADGRPSGRRQHVRAGARGRDRGGQRRLGVRVEHRSDSRGSMEWSGSRLDFAWMTQRNPEFGATFDDVGAVASGARVCARMTFARRGCPCRRCHAACRSSSCRSSDRAAVDRAVPDVAPARTSRPTSSRPIAQVRPIRLPHIRGCSLPRSACSEDPATGGASGPLGSYLVRHSLVTPEQARSILNLQGVKLGRPSWIHISIESVGRRISRVRVGGTSVFVAEGTMEVED